MLLLLLVCLTNEPGGTARTADERVREQLHRVQEPQLRDAAQLFQGCGGTRGGLLQLSGAASSGISAVVAVAVAVAVAVVAFLTSTHCHLLAPDCGVAPGELLPTLRRS